MGPIELTKNKRIRCCCCSFSFSFKSNRVPIGPLLFRIESIEFNPKLKETRTTDTKIIVYLIRAEFGPRLDEHKSAGSIESVESIELN